jgi:hypothetical protein
MAYLNNVFMSKQGTSLEKYKKVMENNFLAWLDGSPPLQEFMAFQAIQFDCHVHFDKNLVKVTCLFWLDYLIKMTFLTTWSMWHLIKYDQKWAFLVKMDMGVVKWDMEPNGTCTTINFGKENI